MENKLTVKQASQFMGASEEFIRIGLQQKAFPWGYAVKTSTKWTYHIMADKFYECVGKKAQ